MDDRREKMIIHYVHKGKEGNTNPKKFINAHTHGLENYGLRNLCIADYLPPEDAALILNIVTDSILESQGLFDFRRVHCYEYDDGETFMQLGFVKGECYNEDVYIIIGIYKDKIMDGGEKICGKLKRRKIKLDEGLSIQISKDVVD